MNRVGRGGAGNYQPAQAQAAAAQPTPVEQDLELGRTATSDSAHSAGDGDKLERLSSRDDPIVKTGRGGAGNYATPEDLARTEFETSLKANLKAPTAETAPNFRGRGGIGNHHASYADQAEAEERAKADTRARQEQFNQAVIQDVEAALPLPPQAHVHARKNELNR